jgi:hypothetical protein
MNSFSASQTYNVLLNGFNHVCSGLFIFIKRNKIIDDSNGGDL